MAAPSIFRSSQRLPEGVKITINSQILLVGKATGEVTRKVGKKGKVTEINYQVTEVTE